MYPLPHPDQVFVAMKNALAKHGHKFGDDAVRGYAEEFMHDGHKDIRKFAAEVKRSN